MSSSRRNGSVSRAAQAASKNRLHMDRNPTHTRITDPANPAGRRKEIDNVMKRARQASPGSWDRRLLEVEEKDPNRWRHTGYKQLYLEGAGSVSPRRSRSPVARARSPVARARSPVARARSPVARARSPVARARSPVARARSPVARRSRSPVRRERSPVRRERSNVRRERTPARRSPRRSPKRSPYARRSPPPARRSPPRAPPARRPPPQGRPPSPPPRPGSSGSGSSGSSCSDDSCSVCSAKNKKNVPPPQPPKGVKPPPRPAAGGRAVQPTRELLKAREASKRSREEKVLEWQRSQLAVAPRAAPIPPAQIKREGERPRPRRAPASAPAPGLRPVSPAAIAAALAHSASDTDSEPSEPAPHRLTLSERFGKMAQWSADRSARLENMRITRRDSALHVAYIERARDPEAEAESPLNPSVEAAPVGSYPEELLAVAPAGVCWDDVRVRYDYYKKRGYLRGLTLADYVKWEDWWYKYQEWLKRERAYERWADPDAPPVRRERRRRGGRHRRS